MYLVISIVFSVFTLISAETGSYQLVEHLFDFQIDFELFAHFQKKINIRVFPWKSHHVRRFCGIA